MQPKNDVITLSITMYTISKLELAISSQNFNSGRQSLGHFVKQFINEETKDERRFNNLL